MADFDPSMLDFYNEGPVLQDEWADVPEPSAHERGQVHAQHLTALRNAMSELYGDRATRVLTLPAESPHTKQNVTWRAQYIKCGLLLHDQIVEALSSTAGDSTASQDAVRGEERMKAWVFLMSFAGGGAP
jgi:hypothetical protein